MTVTKQTDTSKPIIFLAFANVPANSAGYLRNLAVEQRGIRNVLRRAQQAGLCEVIERSNATIEDILDVFQDEVYKDRIAIFHYGGHADCYKLLLESVTGARSFAFRDGLALFLARQKGLKLVFLNACSTEQHAQELQQAGIPAVIGTSQEISDHVATILAIRFYNGLAHGYSIFDAWQDAVAAIKILKGATNIVGLYHWEYPHNDRFPWDIFFKEGAELVKEWNLPHAVNDPLFGLPPVPQHYPLPDPPFLFLRAYEAKHAQIFFGRSHYIRALYNRITAKHSAPIILLYGQSGVGKSSLLEAGLLPRLAESHTILYIRRNQELGLVGTLAQALSKWQPPEGDWAQIWKHIESQTGKPLLVILDQMEEVLTHPQQNGHREFTNFIEVLKAIFRFPASYPQGKFILSYRKEFHAEFDKQLSLMELERTPVFLESLQSQDIVEVVTGLTRTPHFRDHYNLTIEEPLPIIIANDLLADLNSPVAPTLQIVLTRLWAYSKRDEYSPHRFFTTSLYLELKKDGLLLEDFFQQQMAKLAEANPEMMTSGLVLDLLKFFTTPLGTACSRDRAEIQRRYPHNLEGVENLVEQLKHLYLLTDTPFGKDKNTLAHDTLAPIIIKEYNDSDKPGQRAARVLAARLEDFKKDKQRFFLDENDLLIVEQGKKGMPVLTPLEEELIAESWQRKRQRERQLKRFKLMGVALMMAIVIFAIVAFWQWQVASNRERLINADYLAGEARIDAAKNPTLALRKAEKAHQLQENERTIAALHDIYRDNIFYKILARFDAEIKSLSFSRDGQFILADFENGTQRQWDLSGKEVFGIKESYSNKSGCDSPLNAPYTLTSSEEGTIGLWNARNIKLRDLIGHEGRKLSQAFSPDGNTILTGSKDNTARLWDIWGNPLLVLRGHEGPVTHVVFSPDGRLIITASDDKTLRLWEFKDKELTSFKGHEEGVNAVAFSPDGKNVLTGSSDRTIRLWDLQGHSFEPFNYFNDSVTALHFSPDGNTFLAGCGDGIILLMDLKGKVITQFKGHTGQITSLDFSPDRQKIVSGSFDRTLRLWDITGKELLVLNGYENRITAVTFSPDGNYILVGSFDGTACLWNLEGKKIQTFPTGMQRITALAFLPDSLSILAVSGNRVLHWDMEGKELASFEVSKDIVLSLAVSQDGQMILTGSADRTACLWDLKGNLLQHFRGHGDVVKSVAFSPDGQHVITGSMDGTARLWKINKVEDFLKNGLCEKEE